MCEHICSPLFQERYGTEACSGNERILLGNIKIILYTLELTLHALNSCSDILISEQGVGVEGAGGGREPFLKRVSFLGLAQWKKHLLHKLDQSPDLQSPCLPNVEWWLASDSSNIKVEMGSQEQAI